MNTQTRAVRSPRTKEELLNKMLSYDFDGDLRKLGENVRITRASANSLLLTFPDLDRAYEVCVRIPRGEH